MMKLFARWFMLSLVLLTSGCGVMTRKVEPNE